MAAKKRVATEGGGPTVVGAEQATDAAAPKKRGPGRPKGSKAGAAKAAAAPAKRGPGRPKGSKNRATVARKAGAAGRAAGRRRGRRAASGENIGDRIDRMIAELTALKSEVGKLEQMRSYLRDLPQI